jgi:hypothetical protein
MWQVYTRPTSASDFFFVKSDFFIETAKLSKPKLKMRLKKVGGQIFELQFLFLKSSKIFIYGHMRENYYFFQILTTMDSHNFGVNYQNTHFFCSLNWLTSFFVKKLKKTFFGEFCRPAKICVNFDFCHFLHFFCWLPKFTKNRFLKFFDKN